MAKKSAVILTSYIENDFPMEEQIRPDDLLICADGGWDIALEHGLSPDVIIGDLDSVTTELPQDIQIIPFDPVKDFTDLQLALDHAKDQGAVSVKVWGGIGGRLDHTVANIQLLEKYSQVFCDLTIKDGANKAMIIPPGKEEGFTADAKEGWYFSLFSLSPKCEGVTIKGAKYEITDCTLTRDFPLGVSNEFAQEKAAISYDSGTLLFIMSKK